MPPAPGLNDLNTAELKFVFVPAGGTFDEAKVII